MVPRSSSRRKPIVPRSSSRRKPIVPRRSSQRRPMVPRSSSRRIRILYVQGTVFVGNLFFDKK